MPKAAAKNFKIGPTSRSRAIAEFDRRTKIGRLYKATMSDLVAHVGGAPTAAELLLIESITTKAVRVRLLTERLLAGEEIATGTDHHLLAWSNAMGRELAMLGLASRARDITPTIDDIKAEHASKREAAE